MRIKVIVNPEAGGQERVSSLLHEVLDPSGVTWDVVVTRDAGDSEGAARTAGIDGYDVVGAYGGDGTAAAVAAGVAGTGTPLLLLPGGTGNALADDLGIPADVREAAALITGDHEVRQLDMGRCGGNLFVLRLTMGLEAAVVASATPDMKARWGWLAYAFAALQALPDAPLATYSITVDGRSFECEGSALLVANSASTGVAGIRIADDVDVSDGSLDLVVVQRADLPALLGIAVSAEDALPPHTLAHWRGSRFRVESRPVQTVLSDGEPAGSTPIEAEVVPGALGVIVPRS